MSAYIATFHTHLSAMRTQRALTQAGYTAALAPVPRRLSSSCGTCVRYTAPEGEPLTGLMDQDVETVVLCLGDGSFRQLFQNE